MTTRTHWLPPDGGWPPCTPFEYGSLFTSHDEAAVTCTECLEWLAERAECALGGGGHQAKSYLGRNQVHTYCGIVVPHSLLGIKESTVRPITCQQCQTAAWIEAIRTGAA